jgi:hypothetical protein
MITSATQSMLNALVGLTRLESQVSHTLRNVNDPHALAMGDDEAMRRRIQATADALAAALREESIDFEA